MRPRIFMRECLSVRPPVRHAFFQSSKMLVFDHRLYQSEKGNILRAFFTDALAHSETSTDFLDVFTHRYKRVCPSIGPSFRNAVFSNTQKRVILTFEGEGMLREGRRRKEGNERGAGEGLNEGVTRGTGHI